MITCLIAAVSDNLVLGHHGKMPWHLPADLKHFRNLTMGSPILMGRKTFESIGRPLPGRLNLIITHNRSYSAEGIETCGSLEEAFTRAQAAGTSQCFLIGGGQLYRKALETKRVDLIYITRVHHTFDGDVFFPVLDTRQWEQVANRRNSADAQHAYSYSFETWIPRQSPTSGG